MWVFCNDSAVSIVQDRDSWALLVRARVAGDIERFIGPSRAQSLGLVVKEMPPDEADYRYRAWVPRQIVRDAVADRVAGIGYPDFKGSVESETRSAAYSLVWAAWQHRAIAIDEDG